MNIEYVGRHYDVTDADRAYAEDKLSKVIRFLDEPIEVQVTMDVEKHRHIADVHLTHRHGALQSREMTDHMMDALNLAIDKIEKQARRAKKKFVDKRRRAQRSEADERRNDVASHQWPVDVVERDSVRGGGVPKIIKSSMIRIKPMSIEEAALQLDGSSNDFVVFRDAETDEVSVLYKRRDSNYGLIAPGA